MIHNSNILLYLPPAQADGIKLRTMVASVVVRENIVTGYNTDNLFRILSQPMHGIAAAIILVSTYQELLELQKFKDMILRIPTILILPDQNRDTITKGFVLRPRFLTYADSDFSEVRDVFRKIISKVNFPGINRAYA
ncbi:MAG: hypothetical protein KAH06_04380 [Desulfobacterales bacterium]|nr:hypothetical protein [Desulfobacterales bacterium]